MERLRTAITPQTAVILLMIALAAAFMMGTDGTDECTKLEARAGQVLSQMQGAGKVSVVISMKSVSGQNGSSGFGSREEQLVPSGAVAVAQGADDPFVCARLTQALCALLGLPASCVSILSGG
ncbi:MAG: hypothetical protein IKV90_06490 [Clostridia bacterium]|nr:hypothetical protein [Clostridia bacterium]